MSKCFGDLMKLFEEEGVEPRTYDVGDSHFFDKFESPEQYVKCKIRMLEDEMYIKPSQQEIDHLKELTTETAINAAVRAIINKHWS